MNELYIGMDVHSKSIYCIAQDWFGKVLFDGRIETKPEVIKEFLMNFPGGRVPKGTRIGFESGTQATWLSRLLDSLGMEPLVIDAHEVRKKARRIGQKTDRRDAFEICEGIRKQMYDSIVYIPDEETQKLKDILKKRRHFVNICVREKNSAKALLRGTGISTSRLPLKGKTSWENLCKRLGDNYRGSYARMHMDVWEMAYKKVEELEVELNEALEPFKDIMDILTTVPGVGLITAATFIGTVGTPRRFPDSSRVVSYVGLAASTFDSGEHTRHGSITKRGPAELRTMLCEAAQSARKSNNPFNPYFLKICSKKGYKKAIVAVAHKMAKILYQMWKRKESFDIRKTNIESGEFVKTKKVYYKIKKKAARV